MILNTRSYEDVLQEVKANLVKYQIPDDAIAYFRNVCLHIEHLEQAVKPDGTVVIVCLLCGMDTFL